MDNDKNLQVVDEMLNSFDLIVKKALKGTTQTYDGIVVGKADGNKWKIKFNNGVYNVKLYGESEPEVNSIVKVFVPQGNYNLAWFFVKGGGGGQTKMVWKKAEIDTLGEFIGITDDKANINIQYAGGTWVATIQGYETSYRPSKFRAGIFCSKDGKRWREVYPLNTKNKLHYYQDKWVIISKNYIYYSFDGETWFNSTVASNLTDVLYHNNIFVAYGKSGIFYSKDCVTWESSNISPFIEDNFINTYVVYDNGVWLCTGTYDMSTMGIYYSTDGKNWNQSVIDSNYYFGDFMYHKNVWVCSNKEGANIYYYSEDNGITWQASNGIGQGRFNTLNYLNDIFIGSGIYSYDGKTWNTGGLSNYSKLYYNNGVYINNAYPIPYYSYDIVDWFPTYLPQYHDYEIKCIDGLWIAVDAISLAGSETESDKIGVFYSNDGIDWTQTNLTNVSTISFAKENDKLLVKSNGVWMALGYKNNSVYSLDGKKWEETNLYWPDWRQSRYSATLFGLYKGNGVWVCIRPDGFWYSEFH